MRSSKQYTLLSFFILFTALKLLFPNNAYELRADMDALTAKSFSYTDIIVSLGRAVTDGTARPDVVHAIARCFYPNTAVRRASDRMYLGEEQPEVEGSDATRGEGRGEAEQSKQLPEAVRAFIEAQEEFKGYAIPANVRIDMPAIPFEYTSPVDGLDSSGFGYRLHPIKNEIRFHYGTDFAADKGECVRAFADGYVYAAGVSDSYGCYYILAHKGGFSTLYAHLSEFSALEGEAVKKGQTIGKVGDTGDSTGPHLHFELSLNNMYVNPEYYV